uniref:BTB domain-containing protein n=1 Tax=Crocodylus porosus TaxID=8502 RepID=A0A7M4G1N4_CROPO
MLHAPLPQHLPLLCRGKPWCTHLECARLLPLHHLLLLRFWLHYSPHLFIYALPVCGPTKSRDLLVNLLLGPAKLAIYLTRREALDGRVPRDRRATFLALIHSHLQPEHHWAASTGSLDSLGNALMFNNELMADVHFVVGPPGASKKVPAHKYVLAVGSSVFYAMFYGDLAEVKSEIHIPDVEPAAFLILLK